MWNFNKLKELCGTITPISWDNDGYPVQFSIYTFEGDDIVIKNFPKRKISNYINQPVLLKGKTYTNTQDVKCVIPYQIEKLIPSGNTSNGLNRSSTAEDSYKVYLPEECPIYPPDTWQFA